MYHHIMIPVDLAHRDRLGKALDTGALLARTSGARITLVGVTVETPTRQGHTPAEYAASLERFAAEEAARTDIPTEAHACIGHDPSVELDSLLLKTAETLNVDCIVMASHIPTFADRLWPSHGGAIARRAKASVFIVR